MSRVADSPGGGWEDAGAELFDTLPATSAFIQPGQELYLYDNKEHSQGRPTTAAFASAQPEWFGGTWPGSRSPASHPVAFPPASLGHAPQGPGGSPGASYSSFTPQGGGTPTMSRTGGLVQHGAAQTAASADTSPGPGFGSHGTPTPSPGQPHRSVYVRYDLSETSPYQQPSYIHSQLEYPSALYMERSMPQSSYGQHHRPGFGPVLADASPGGPALRASYPPPNPSPPAVRANPYADVAHARQPPAAAWAAAPSTGAQWGRPTDGEPQPPYGRPASPPRAQVQPPPPYASASPSTSVNPPRHPAGPMHASVAQAEHESSLYGGGPVRHVVDELRTSPLVGYGDASPSGSALGGTGGGVGASTQPGGEAGTTWQEQDRVGGGGAAAPGARRAGGGTPGSAEKSAEVQRLQAQVVSLDRQATELQKRVTDLSSALQAAQAARQELELMRDEALTQLSEANKTSRTRDSTLEAARVANDRLTGELKAAQEELASVRNALAAAHDDAVRWQDQAGEHSKELDAARRKIEQLGEGERRLSAENQSLRKELQQLNDALIKGRIEASELRERLLAAQQDTARQAQHVSTLASRAELDGESATAAMAAMRARCAELEARNSQLLYDLAGFREEAQRAKQAELAARQAARQAPAGVASDLTAASRQPYGGPAPFWQGDPAPPAAPSAAYPSRAESAGLAPPSAAAAAPLGRNAGLPPPEVTAAALMQKLPRGVEFSKLDPETFRAMVRAEAEALARVQPGADSGHGAAAGAGPGAAAARTDNGRGEGGGGGGGAAREGHGYGSRGGDEYGGKPSGGYEPASYYGAARPGANARESSGQAAAERPAVRSVWAPPPDSDTQHNVYSVGSGAGGEGAYGGRPGAARALWAAPPAAAAAAAGRGAGEDGGHGAAAPGGAPAGSPPPPYALHSVDPSYPYRRAPNAVGVGVLKQQAGLAAVVHEDSPFGTEETAKALLARSKALEDALSALCAEKGSLEAEFARLPLGAGRTLRERNRKAVVEQRLELLNKEIGAARSALKRLGVK